MAAIVKKMRLLSGYASAENASDCVIIERNVERVEKVNKMTKAFTGLMAVALAAAVLAGPAAASKMAKGKMVTIYQAEKCHMYFTPKQAVKDHYACPISHGKMHKMMVSQTFAKKVLKSS
jgi:hypothetical protein